MRSVWTAIPFTMSVMRRSMWSRARKLSGTITRSTDEWLMSRSCHKATFSSAAIAFARTSRARPVTCSHPTGLRLWGMADEPFWPAPNGSSTSRTSVFCRARISVANFSRLAAVTARVVMTSAWRSRCRTCDETGAGRSPSFGQTASSTSGPRCEKVPTAPDSLPTAIVSRARASRCERAAQLGVPERELEAEGHGLGVHAVGAPDHRRVLELVGARAHHLAQRLARPGVMRSVASRMSMASAVSTTSDEVRP